MSSSPAASAYTDSHTIVPLYIDINGNLTTDATDSNGNANTEDWRRGFQRTNGSAPLYQTQATKFDLIITGNSGSFLLTDGITTISLPWNVNAAAIDSAIESFASVGANNATVSLVPANVGDSFKTWRITLNSPAGNPDFGVVTGSVATMWSDSVLTTDSTAYRQAIIVVNNLVYVDSDGNKTLDPTNNKQSIIISSDSQSVDLYIDAEGNPTTDPINPSIIVTDELHKPSGVTLVDLYQNKLGQTTTLLTPNRLYQSTDSNSAPLVYYDIQGLEVQTADQSTARVQDNGTSAGTAQYSLTKNQKATIEVYRQELVVGTRATQLYRSVLDSGIDTFIIEHSGSSTSANITLDYDGASDTSTLAGTLPTNFSVMGEALEAIEVNLGDQADNVVINTSEVSTTFRTNGGVDTVIVENSIGASNIYTGDDNDTVTIKNIRGDSLVHAGNNNDTINVGNNAGRLNDIDATLTINGNGDFDTVNINNINANTDTAGELFHNLITGLDMSGMIVYETAEDINVDLGTGNDDFVVASTHTGTTDITANIGDNEILVKSIDGDTSIISSSGNDTITVGDAVSPLSGIRALLTIDATTGDNDTLILVDTASTAIRSGNLSNAQLSGFGLAELIDYANFENVTYHWVVSKTP